MKIERVKFSDAVMIAGYEENVIPNGRLAADKTDIELDGDVFAVRHDGKTVYVPKSNCVYWYEAATKAAPAKPQAKTAT